MLDHHEEKKNTYLYIGVNPTKDGEQVIESFSGENLVPLSWFFLFSPDEVVTRQQEFPGSFTMNTKKSKKRSKTNEITLENLEQQMNEPVAFRTSLPEAKTRLAEYKETFKKIPYMWSYFRVIEILDKQLEHFISDLETIEDYTPQLKLGPHPLKPLSQIEMQSKKEEPSIIDMDNPFAGLEDFGFPTEKSEPTTSKGSLDSISDEELLLALQEAAMLDQPTDTEKIEYLETEEEYNFLPIVLHFDTIAIDGRGSRYARIPLLLERLLHHAKREGELTRVMQDLMQEIFREANTGWRITGLLAEDFIQGDTKLLANIMIGSHSPFILISESFDLEYWTKGTLQKGDERIMYNQTMLPSEEIHRALKAGKLDQISETIGVMIMETQRTKVPKITRDLLNELPVNSNLWGFRLLIQDINREFKAASILCSDPNTSWEKEFKEKINLPGVLEDWNIELQARFEEFTDIDKYSLVFEGARDLDETVNGFVRWIRRHNLMYRQRFGIKGTVMELKNALAETSDKILGQQIFNILTKLTELGVYEAIDVLSDDAIVRKLPWLYS